MKNQGRYDYNRYSYNNASSQNVYIRSNVRKKKSKKPLIAVISVIFLLTAATAAFVMLDGMSLIFPKNDDNSVSALWLEETKTKHVSFNDEKYESSSKSADKYFINYPLTKIDEIDAEINSETEYLAKCANASSARFTTYDYITETADNKYLSVVFNSTEYDEDKNVVGKDVFTMFFDINAKKQMKMDDVFKSNFYSYASEYVIKYFNNNTDTKKLTSSESFKSATTADKLHFEKFSINDKFCTFYFNQKNLFGKGDKIYDVSISLGEISSYLNISLSGAEVSSNSGESPNIRNYIDPDKPMIALTFDDGPHYTNTEKILDVLKQNDSCATFFVVGDNAEAYPEILKDISDAGCQIGNHTKNHKDLTNLTDDEIKQEVDYVDKIVKKATGSPTTIIRPPYGAYDKNVQKVLNKTPLIFWDIDTEDWLTLNAKKTIDAVMDQTSDGEIILLHDIHDSTAKAAETFIPRLRAEGYQLVTIEELIYYKGINIKGGETYPW